MCISEKIFEILREKGMTQREFGQRTGIPQSTISDWKSKKLNPSSEKILIICDVLDISPYELLSTAENARYETPDHVIVMKDSQEYRLIEDFRSLEKDKRNRLLGYMEAIRSL